MIPLKKHLQLKIFLHCKFHDWRIAKQNWKYYNEQEKLFLKYGDVSDFHIERCSYISSLVIDLDMISTTTNLHGLRGQCFGLYQFSEFLGVRFPSRSFPPWKTNLMLSIVNKSHMQNVISLNFKIVNVLKMSNNR